MTKVGSKTWMRETDSPVFEAGVFRNVIVCLAPHGVISFRLKGTRRKYDLTAASCYMKAMTSVLFKEKMEKAKLRKFKARRSRI